VRPVERAELLGLEAYEARRDAVRAAVIETKRRRRVHLAGALTFLFENRDTVRYQVQEMLRAERLFLEDEVRHELDTYNELLGGPGELGATLLIELPDPAERDRLLRAWVRLPAHLYAVVPGGARVAARFDPRQVGEERLSSVQYLRFPVGGVAPVALGCDHPALTAEAPLTEEQRAALAQDLAAG
jgi:hypothetical protein